MKIKDFKVGQTVRYQTEKMQDEKTGVVLAVNETTMKVIGAPRSLTYLDFIQPVEPVKVKKLKKQPTSYPEFYQKLTEVLRSGKEFKSATELHRHMVEICGKEKSPGMRAMYDRCKRREILIPIATTKSKSRTRSAPAAQNPAANQNDKQQDKQRSVFDKLQEKLCQFQGELIKIRKVEQKCERLLALLEE